MKANPITLGFVNLLLCLHCGAFSRFLHPLVLLLHLKRFSCMCRSWEPSTLNHRKCRMIGECNCACMPAQNPFGCYDLFLSASPVSSCTGLPLWIPFKCFPTNPFGWAHRYLLCFLHWVYDVVFVCFNFVLFLYPHLPLWFSDTSWACFFVQESCYLFVVCLCFVTRGFFFFQSYAAFLSRGVQIQNYSKNILSVYSQCSCHLVYSDPLLEEIKAHWAWLGSMVILGSHLEMLFTVPCGSITI